MRPSIAPLRTFTTEETGVVGSSALRAHNDGLQSEIQRSLVLNSPASVVRPAVGYTSLPPGSASSAAASAPLNPLTNPLLAARMSPGQGTPQSASRPTVLSALGGVSPSQPPPPPPARGVPMATIATTTASTAAVAAVLDDMDASMPDEDDAGASMDSLQQGGLARAISRLASVAVADV